jgi:transcription antitermination factor NusG
MSGYWALVTTQPNCERIATRNLGFQDIESYAPRYRKQYFQRGKKHERLLYLFPGYLFVRVVGIWRGLLSTRGVLQVLGGARPSIVPDAMVEDLMHKEKIGQGSVPLPWYVGQKLRVKDGAFAGELVVYEGMGKHDRERVLLMAMGGYVPIELSGSNLEAVR